MPHPLCLQSTIEVSSPWQFTSSNQILPLPAPNRADPGELIASRYPNWRQMTRASFISQESSQTVPQMLLWNTSTLPSELVDPPTNLKAEIIFNKMFSCNFWPLYYLKPKYKHQNSWVNYTWQIPWFLGLYLAFSCDNSNKGKDLNTHIITFYCT